jgi:small subunit ribosomal protein S6
MTASNATYDLVLLLDPDAEDPTRARIIADTRAAIDADGEVLRHDLWGNRALSYPIQRRTSAEYHLLQFRATDPGLLSRLNRSLRITDGIIRFRIIKLKPGVPEPPDMATSDTVSGTAGANAEGSALAPTGGRPPASSGGPPASASDPATSGGDAAGGGAARASEPGAAGAAEDAERVQAGST